MRDFEESTLWRISAYERLREETGTSGFAALAGTTGLPSTLHAELDPLLRNRRQGDVVEIVAACMRLHESALLLLRLGGLVWPLTLFPQVNLYHLPRSIFEPLREHRRDLSVISVEPPGLRPPGHFMHERIGDGPAYRHLPPLLWALALHAPNARLLQEIAGRAAYRLATTFEFDELEAAGAMLPALRRLRGEIASLHTIASWPGMDRDRATRLLNGAYLQGGLIVLRTHNEARDGDDAARGFARWLRRR